MNKPIVIFRTVSVEKMSPVLEACRKRWPDSPLWIISSEARAVEMSSHAYVSRVISYDAGPAGFSKPISIVRRPQSVVVPVANEGGSGYGNVLSVALGIASTDYLICSRCRELRSLGRIGFRCKALSEALLGTASRLVSGYWAERLLER